MKETSSFSTPCETAAIRIQYWFGKDKEHFLPFTQPSTKTQPFFKKYKCDLVKPPRIPSQVEHLPLQGYVLSKKKRSTKQRQVTKENFSKMLRYTIDQSHCTICQKNLNYLQPINALSAARVAYCRLKEHFLVSKRLKTISKQEHTGPKRHDVVRIKSSSQQDLSDNLHLQEWGRINQEQHFQIGRVIKYLSD
ncbi:MAG: hypothetical protein WA347_04425 [Rhabdochlamydiaceae bacterium]|jgi:hypothetical protein